MKSKSRTLKFALKQSLPVLFGYLFLGSAFGVMLYEAGYNWIWAIFISLFVYAGSGQFLLCSLITQNASIPTVAVMTLFINSRHLFYGLSFVEKFKAGGWRYPFMIFGLTDETYSVNTSLTSFPDGVDEPRARYLISVFDHCYWILGSVIGALAGQLIPIDFEGIDFSMTALFVVIFIDLVREQKGKIKIIGPAGIFVALICLVIVGADKFLLPALIMTVVLLLATKGYFSTEIGVNGND